ncbi:hypothetical protein CAE01nite_13530 [Cellulomonas aerilata]|uniref:Uncharacterized protein n=2 Tax=Cellulomonas aerilata TaxID=515326 RepID=A0A512DAY7_9CELL|nr:hypothetical protein CAE01nite_13530 [Cellulomonas aerilata]
MRVGRLLVSVACVGVLALMVWFALTENPAATWMVYGLYGAGAATFVVRAVRARRRGVPVARSVAPALRGLGEVQDMSLGRPPVPPVTYASPVGTVAELVVAPPEPAVGALGHLPARPPDRRT